MTKRYFIFLSYNGQNYSGWQMQPNAPSVQEAIEKALSILLRVPTSIVGAGRTDAGVHARMMIAHFDCSLDELNTDDLTAKLNRFLPPDIAIRNIKRVRPDAHARFDALSRMYSYHITTAKDPFGKLLKYRYHTTLDVKAMNDCARLLFEYTDFTSFSKLHTDVKTNNCEIMHAEWVQNDTEYIFTIKANRFLRNMVRAIVGTMLEVGRGKITLDDVRYIIEACDRSRAGSSVPGHALFLEDVEYSPDIFFY